MHLFIDAASPTWRGWPRSVARFDEPPFDTRPIASEPRSDKRIIPLACLGGRPLGTEAQAVQRATQVIGVVAHAVAMLDDMRDTPQRPALGGKACHECPCAQSCCYLLPLRGRQSRGAPWVSACTQRTQAART